mgnify:FL=1|jgi:hypothetical protein
MFDEVKANKEARLNLLEESKESIYEQWKSEDSGFLIVVNEDSLNRYKTNSVSEKIIELVESDFDIGNASCFYLEKPSIASHVFQYNCEKIYYEAVFSIEQKKTLQKILSTHAELIALTDISYSASSENLKLISKLQSSVGDIISSDIEEQELINSLILKLSEISNSIEVLNKSQQELKQSLLKISEAISEANKKL